MTAHPLEETSGTARLIHHLTQEAAAPERLEPGYIYGWLSDGQVHEVDLTADRWLDLPRRKQGTVTVTDTASFAQYHAKHADGDTEVFTDLDAATITAVLDAHETDCARWQQHRLILAMRKTPEWITWTTADRKLMSQQDFAEFIEDNIACIVRDGPVSAADLLELAQNFQVHTKISFGSGNRLSSGETQFTYVEESTASAGKRGTISVPPEFEIGIAPLDDCAPYRIEARFRHRSSEQGLRLGYHLDDPARIFRNAVAEVVAKAEEACGITIMRGRPS